MNSVLLPGSPHSLALLDGALVHFMLEQYVVLQPHQYLAVALWALHTHVYNRFMVTPRLALQSPVADCGKTTLLDVLSRLTARPEKFNAITIAALFRLIDETHPTLLIDEADNRHVARVFNPDRKETHWGKRKLKRYGLKGLACGWRSQADIGCRCPFSRAVPELTRSADIQLDKRLSLRRRLEMLSQPQIVD
jgi:hypothetical protein